MGNANHGERRAIKKAYRQSIQVGKRSFLCSRVRESSKETMYLVYVDTHEYMRHRAVHDTDYRSRNPTLSYGERNSSVTRSNWYSSQARIYASRSPIWIGVGQVNSLVPCMNRVSREIVNFGVDSFITFLPCVSNEEHRRNFQIFQNKMEHKVENTKLC